MVVEHSLIDYPIELKKKVLLIQHFKNYLDGNEKKIGERETKLEKVDDKIVQSENKIPLIYVKKWMRTRHAIMFRLSNKVVQVAFQDRTEVILNSETREVTYLNKKGERKTYPLASALETSDPEMSKRLKYAKDILTHMLAANKHLKCNTPINP